MDKLYRAKGYHNFCSNNETFSAKIVAVKNSGELVVERDSGEQQTFAFKQVSFVA
jgi:biotin-(acetyl-CoA carboxylase) ligase